MGTRSDTRHDVEEWNQRVVTYRSAYTEQRYCMCARHGANPPSWLVLGQVEHGEHSDVCDICDRWATHKVGARVRGYSESREDYVHGQVAEVLPRYGADAGMVRVQWDHGTTALEDARDVHPQEGCAETPTAKRRRVLAAAYAVGRLHRRRDDHCGRVNVLACRRTWGLPDEGDDELFAEACAAYDRGAGRLQPS